MNIIGRLTACLFLISAWTAAAAGLPVRVKVVNVVPDHLGKQPSQHVVLQSAGGSEFVQIFPDASHGDCCFRVPAGKVLVVTDVDWIFNLGAANVAQTMRIFVNNLANPKSINYPYQSTAILDANGHGGASQSLTSGFVVNSKARLGYDAVPSGGTLASVVVRGYLTDDK